MITVLTLGRTASTWYCNHLAKEMNYTNLDGILYTETKTRNFLLNKEINEGSVAIPKINPESPYVVKLLTTERNHLLYNRVLRSSNYVVFLFRKDFYAQIKSTFSGIYARQYLGKTMFDQFEEPIIIPKDYIQKHWERIVDVTEENLLYMCNLYSTIIANKKLVFTEDVVQHEYNRLKRPFVYEIEPEYPAHLEKIIEELK